MNLKYSLLLFYIVISGAAICQNRDRKMVIITFDGYRWEDVFKGADSAKLAFSLKGKKDSAQSMKRYWSSNPLESRKKLMPFLWNTIAAKGQVYGNRDLGCNANVKNRYWFSYPGYNEIFTGYPDTIINSNDYGPNPNITLLEYLNKQEQAFKNKVAAFASWAAFTRILNKDRSGIPINAGFTDFDGNNPSNIQKFLNQEQHLLPKVFGPNERHDAVTYYLSKEYLKQNHPRVLYVAFIETDAYAHRDLYDMYIASGNNNDAMIADIWNYLQSDPFYKDQTTLFLATDHGRGNNETDNWTHHNSKTPGSDQVWLAAMGPYTPALGEMKNKQVYQNQYAKTMAALLDVNFIGPHPMGEMISTIVSGK